MARISTYTLDTTISNSDKLVGTDAENSENTKNYKVQDLIAFTAKNMPLPAFDNDAAAGTGVSAIATGTLYKTTGNDLSLPVAGVVMVKQ
jgi:hypothetical protein